MLSETWAYMRHTFFPPFCHMRFSIFRVPTDRPASWSDSGPTARRPDPTDRPGPTPTDPPTARRGGPTDRPAVGDPGDDEC